LTDQNKLLAAIVVDRHIKMVPWLTALVLLAVVAHADRFAGRQRLAFQGRSDGTAVERTHDGALVNLLLVDTVLRGGGVEKVAVDLEEEEDTDEDEEDEDSSLAASTRKKIDRTKRSSVKKEVASQLAKTGAVKKDKKTKARSSSFTIVPYIVRASLNPFTFFAMVKLYWVTYFDFDYMKKRQVAGQELRSALEEKAKRSSPYSGSKKAKRKMKPGQAKTLNDLPQLSS
jgi:hypothetical protein